MWTRLSPAVEQMTIGNGSRSQKMASLARFGGRRPVLVDTGPLLAAAITDDSDHERCQDLLARTDLQLIIPIVVVSETAYMIGQRLGPRAEGVFLWGIARLDVEQMLSRDWKRMSELVAMYRNFPLGTVDASTITIAERLGISTIITLDRRHFLAVRPSHVAAFDLLPE